jgi:hypothetical protein
LAFVEAAKGPVTIMHVSRKSGIRAKPISNAKKKARDEKILGSLLKNRSEGKALLASGGAPEEPLAVYGYLPFPILFQSDDKRMPRWDELTPWLKLQLCILAFSEWEKRFQTFTIHLNQTLVDKWIKQSVDIRSIVRDRLRRELDSQFGIGREFLFVVEGLSRRTKSPTRLHIHGGIMVEHPGDGPKAIRAAERAAGQGMRSYAKEPRATKWEPYYGGGSTWGNYILKAVGIKDERLADKRLAMSRSAISAGREFWDFVTGRWGPQLKLQQLITGQGLSED